MLHVDFLTNMSIYIYIIYCKLVEGFGEGDDTILSMYSIAQCQVSGSWMAWVGSAADVGHFVPEDPRHLLGDTGITA